MFVEVSLPAALNPGWRELASVIWAAVSC